MAGIRVNSNIKTLSELDGVDLLPLVEVSESGDDRAAGVTLDTMKAFAAFDLHDDVATELTTLANADRFITSDESENGDPNRRIQAQNVAKYVWERYVMVLTANPTQTDIDGLPDKGVIIVRETTAYSPA